VVNKLNISRIEKVLYIEERLDSLDAGISKRGLLGLQVDLKVLTTLQVRDNLVDDEILIRGLLCGP